MKQIYFQSDKKKPLRQSIVLEVATGYLLISTSDELDKELLCKGPPGRTPGPVRHSP